MTAKSEVMPQTQVIKNPGVSFVNADGTAYKTLYTAPTYDAVIKAIGITSSDGTIRNLKFAINDGAVDRVIGTVRVPVNSGTDGAVPTVDALASLLMPQLPPDQNAKKVLTLQGTYALKVAPLVAVTAGATIDVVANVEEFAAAA